MGEREQKEEIPNTGNQLNPFQMKLKGTQIH